MPQDTQNQQITDESSLKHDIVFVETALIPKVTSDESESKIDEKTDVDKSEFETNPQEIGEYSAL